MWTQPLAQMPNFAQILQQEDPLNENTLNEQNDQLFQQAEFGNLQEPAWGSSISPSTQETELAQIAGYLSQLASNMQTQGGPQSNMPCGSPLASMQASTQPFQNFSASSVGDPHDACHATTANGSVLSNTWDNMQSHNDLLNSSSFQGGFQIASQTTAPNAQGITMNGQVSIATDYGTNHIALNADGDASISTNGHWQNLTPGSSIQLSGGTQVSEDTNQRVTVTENGINGATISAVMQANHQGGVDLHVTGQDISVGGYLASQLQ